MDNPVENGLRPPLTEWRSSGCSEGNRRSPREDIDRLCRPLSEGLLRSHPTRRSEDVPGLRQYCAVDSMGDAKVDDFGSGWSHEDIGGLQVTMNDSDGVHGHEGFGQSDGESDQLLAHERPVGSYVLVEVALCYVLGREDMVDPTPGRRRRIGQYRYRPLSGPPQPPVESGLGIPGRRPARGATASAPLADQRCPRPGRRPPCRRSRYAHECDRHR